MDLIYCGRANNQLDGIAVSMGYKYGMRLPHTVPAFPLYFADQNWKNPDREKYMRELAKYRPRMATVLDWEKPEQRKQVFSWAEEASRYSDIIMIVPKVQGTIPEIPQAINNKEVRLAYSVPTRYAKTDIPVKEFGDRPVHLLGGAPQKQLSLYKKMNVVSIDGNYISMKANRFCEFWTAKKGYTRQWLSIESITGKRVPGANYIAFSLSCFNLIKAWEQATGLKIMEDAVNLVTLEKSDEEGELLLVNGGFCRFHIRKDRQLTIYEIYILKNERGKGIGRKMLEELKKQDCDSIFARCPIDYESNSWYEHMGFVLEDAGEARTGKKLNHWRLIL